MRRAGLALAAAMGLTSCADLSAGAIGTGNTAGVAGVAMLPNGEHASATVYLYKADKPSDIVETVVADSLGHFAFEKLTEGNYLVFVDRNGQVGMLSDTLKLVANATSAVNITLKPYALVLDRTAAMDGYCAVSANTLEVVGALRYWRVPQKSGSYSVQGTAGDGYTVSWDSSALVASLYRNGAKVASDSIIAHAESLVGGGRVGTQLVAGNSSAWAPGLGQQLRVQLAYSVDTVLPDTVNLVKLDDSIRAYGLNNLLRVYAGSRLVLGTMSTGSIQRLELVLDGTSDSLTVTVPNSSAIAFLSVPGVKMSTLLGPKLTLGNTNGRFHFYGATVTLVAHKVY